MERIVVLLFAFCIVVSCTKPPLATEKWPENRSKYVPEDINETDLCVIKYEMDDWKKKVFGRKKYFRIEPTEKNIAPTMNLYNRYIETVFKNYTGKFHFISSSDTLNIQKCIYIVECQYDTIPPRRPPAYEFNYGYTTCPFIYEVESGKEYPPINFHKLIDPEVILNDKKPWEW